MHITSVCWLGHTTECITACWTSFVLFFPICVTGKARVQTSGSLRVGLYRSSLQTSGREEPDMSERIFCSPPENFLSLALDHNFCDCPWSMGIGHGRCFCSSQCFLLWLLLDFELVVSGYAATMSFWFNFLHLNTHGHWLQTDEMFSSRAFTSKVSSGVITVYVNIQLKLALWIWCAWNALSVAVWPSVREEGCVRGSLWQESD